MSGWGRRRVARLVQVRFAPIEQEVVWAERIVAAARDTHGAVAVDGAMVVRPVLARAQRILDQRRPSHAAESGADASSDTP